MRLSSSFDPGIRWCSIVWAVLLACSACATQQLPEPEPIDAVASENDRALNECDDAEADSNVVRVADDATLEATRLLSELIDATVAARLHSAREAGGLAVREYDRVRVPTASCRLTIDSSLCFGVAAGGNVEEAARRLDEAFQEAGFSRRSWHELGNGFAIVAFPEQIDEEGMPLPVGAGRYQTDRVLCQPGSFFECWWKGLFTPKPGWYRAVAVVVTDSELHVDEDLMASTVDEAEKWVGTGAVSPWSGNGTPCPDCRCQALVFEFERLHQRNEDAAFQQVCTRGPVESHLASLLQALRRLP